VGADDGAPVRTSGAPSAGGEVREVAVVVDLCAGSGAVAIAIARAVPAAQVWAVELDPAAAALAERNARENGTGVVVVEGNAATALRELDGRVDVVVANPPYIPPDGIPRDPEVHRWDPPAALYGGGEDGLEVPRAVVGRAKALLRDGGTFLMEHGDQQGAAVRGLVEAAGGFTMIETRQDLAGRDRYVVARREREERR
ncbi:MAG TPA: HemK family protein methyltransferase, partial [Actinomycetales bacterium]|nr:HemK family protein methyltransferase [Actinomycetales bacterium]